MITEEQLIDNPPEAQWCLACSKLSPYIIDGHEWHKKHCGMRDRRNISRIHIIGGPGSGKTTLARALGGYLGIEVHELDPVAFTGPEFEERPLRDRLAAVSAITGLPAWITEGLFVGWTDPLLEHAEMIVWMDDVSWPQSFLRITRRFLSSAIQEANKRQGLERFGRFRDYARHVKQLIQVFFSSRAYYAGNPDRSTGRSENRFTTAAHLKPYADKVIHCCSDQSLESLIAYIHICHEQGS